MRNFRQYDVEFLVKVKQLYRGHFSGRAAWICRSAKLNYMRVSIALHEGYFTLASTIIGIVFLRCNHPIPAETLEIHRQRMATTALLVTLLRALQTAPLCSLLSLIFRQNVDVRTLWTKIFNFNLSQFTELHENVQCAESFDLLSISPAIVNIYTRSL